MDEIIIDTIINMLQIFIVVTLLIDNGPQHNIFNGKLCILSMFSSPSGMLIKSISSCINVKKKELKIDKINKPIIYDLKYGTIRKLCEPIYSAIKIINAKEIDEPGFGVNDVKDNNIIHNLKYIQIDLKKVEKNIWKRFINSTALGLYNFNEIDKIEKIFYILLSLISITSLPILILISILQKEKLAFGIFLFQFLATYFQWILGLINPVKPFIKDEKNKKTKYSDKYKYFLTGLEPDDTRNACLIACGPGVNFDSLTKLITFEKKNKSEYNNFLRIIIHILCVFVTIFSIIGYWISLTIRSNNTKLLIVGGLGFITILNRLSFWCFERCSLIWMSNYFEIKKTAILPFSSRRSLCSLLSICSKTDVGTWYDMLYTRNTIEYNNLRYQKVFIKKYWELMDINYLCHENICTKDLEKDLNNILNNKVVPKIYGSLEEAVEALMLINNYEKIGLSGYKKKEIKN